MTTAPVDWADIALVAIGAAQLVVILVAAGVAAWQVLESRRLRLETHRPFVVVDIEPDEFVFMLTVTNHGNSMARDVRITITPPLDSSLTHWEPEKIKMLTDGIASFAPGRRIQTLVDSAIERDRKKYPDVYRARVQYTDDSGRRKFDDETVLDFGLLLDTREIRRKGVHHVYEELHKIEQLLQQWRPYSGGSGVRIVTEQEDDERQAEIDRIMEERQRLIDAQPNEAHESD